MTANANAPPSPLPSPSPPDPSQDPIPAHDTGYIQLLTPRLLLTPLRPTCPPHTRFLHALINAPLSLSINGSNANIHSAEDAARHIRRNYEPTRRRFGLGTFAVYRRDELAAFVSVGVKDDGGADGDAERDVYDLDALISSARPIGLSNVSRGLHAAYPDVGFNFSEAATGHGYASEAVRALIAWTTRTTADGGRGYERVLGFTSPANGKARRLLERVGMRARGEMGVEVYGQRVRPVVYEWRRGGGAGERERGEGREEADDGKGWMEELGLWEGMELREVGRDDGN